MAAVARDESPLAALWINLLPSGRRALCALAGLPAPVIDEWCWQRLPTADRMRLVRAMYTLAQVSIDCANALAAAGAALTDGLKT